jgi:hypothetical protein
MEMRSHNFEFLHNDELLGIIWEHKRKEKKRGERKEEGILISLEPRVVYLFV